MDTLALHLNVRKRLTKIRQEVYVCDCCVPRLGLALLRLASHGLQKQMHPHEMDNQNLWAERVLRALVVACDSFNFENKHPHRVIKQRRNDTLTVRPFTAIRYVFAQRISLWREGGSGFVATPNGNVVFKPSPINNDKDGKNKTANEVLVGHVQLPAV